VEAAVIAVDLRGQSASQSAQTDLTERFCSAGDSFLRSKTE